MQVSLENRRASTSDRLRPGQVFKNPVTIHYAIQNHTTRMQRITKAFKVYRLMALTIVCVFAGILIGLMCRPRAKNWTERKFMYIEVPGELYLRFLKLMIIPLLVSNVILSFGTIQGKLSGRLVKVAGFLYLASNLISISLAIVITMIMSPGGANRAADFRQRDASATATATATAATASGTIGSYSRIANHHYYHEFHDSIARYREYHPMFYHTNSDEQAPPDEAAQGEDKRVEPIRVALRHIQGTNSQGAGGGQATSGARVKVVELVERSSLTELDRDNASADESQLVGSVAKINDSSGDSNRLSLSTKLPIDVLLDVLRNLIPDSLVGATLQQSRTRLFTPRELKIHLNGSTSPSPHTWQMGHEMVNQPNIIGLLAMSVLTGVVLSHMGEAGKPLLDLCACISELSLRIGMKAIHMAPVCIMFPLISQIARARDLSLMAGELFKYMLTVILALSVYGFLVLPAIYYGVTKKSPLRFFKGLIQAIVASFATSSSSATMALVLNCMSELNLNLIIVRAFGPLGSVFNMNGTSIFEVVAVIFIAQTLDIQLPLTSLLLIGLCSAVASLSTAGIPSSGMMTMVIVLNAINLPVLELSLIYIVDFIVDRFRTVVNVWSGAIVCGLIDHICPEELFEDEMKPDKYQEMIRYRASRGSLASRKMSGCAEEKPQVISVTITPPPVESSNI